MEHKTKTTTITKVSDKKLGRGLSSLLGDSKFKAPLTNSINGEVVEKISLQKIRASSFQPRHNFAEKELQELASSIKEHGVIQPIIVRKMEDGFFEIIAGERRYRASKIADLKEIPAIVKKFSDIEVLEVAIIENVQRSDLSIMEEARGYQRLIDEFSYAQDAIAKKVGKSRSHIANLLRLLTLPKKVHEYLDDKLISMGHARAIVNSKNPTEFAKKIIDKNLNVREAEEMVRDEKVNITKKTSSSKTAQPKTPLLIRDESKIKFINKKQLTDLEKRVAKSVGAGCKISYNPSKGECEIALHFKEIALVQKLLQKLGA